MTPFQLEVLQTIAKQKGILINSDQSPFSKFIQSLCSDGYLKLRYRLQDPTNTAQVTSFRISQKGLDVIAKQPKPVFLGNFDFTELIKDEIQTNDSTL